MHPGGLQVSLRHFLSGHPCPETCKGHWRVGGQLPRPWGRGHPPAPGQSAAARGAAKATTRPPLGPDGRLPGAQWPQDTACGQGRGQASCCPLRRQLSMMLMLAQSNPQLFALMGTRASVTEELERMEQQSRLQQLSPAELLSKNRAHWTDWLQEYGARLGEGQGGRERPGRLAGRAHTRHARQQPQVRPAELHRPECHRGRRERRLLRGAAGAEASGNPVPQGFWIQLQFFTVLHCKKQSKTSLAEMVEILPRYI
ncbi:uncharacterized protein LOC125104455 [Lutra lutra]|uniref:uncharacterized protein LOC125104455 n=1 Tax=Lutra lutra TaxID=9657 RepID=UPI001FCF9206|nr:uncharacterized protein LOC125104455 [Lutra lutra]